MQPRFETLHPKKLIGKKLSMSLSQDRTLELWRSFMPERKLATNTIGKDLFCMQQYPPGFDFKNPDQVFEKWAAIEVSSFLNIPGGMESHMLRGGLYAVFPHQGSSLEDARRIFTYIFFDWLPASEYELDDREHFEILGAKYKNNAPDSEEDIWIPVKN
jgi:AraC family transcriptional regulator